MEVPQFTAMRIAMGLALCEDDPTKVALEFYEYISKLDSNPAGGTRINAGGSFPQLSNCFLFESKTTWKRLPEACATRCGLLKEQVVLGLG